MVEMIDGWAAAHERQPALYSPETEAQIKILRTPSCIALVELTGRYKIFFIAGQIAGDQSAETEHDGIDK